MCTFSYHTQGEKGVTKAWAAVGFAQDAGAESQRADIPVLIECARLGALEAHAQAAGLLRYALHPQPQCVEQHGEPGARALVEDACA